MTTSIFQHPNDHDILVFGDKTDIIIDLEIKSPYSNWIQIGYLGGGSQSLLFDGYGEWDNFVEMVNEVDRIKNTKRNNNDHKS